MGKNIYLFGITFLLLAILLIGTISAEIFTIDNVKSFQKTADSYGVATIKNFFGLGSDIMKVELDKNTDSCMINCSAELGVKVFQEVSLFDNIYFKDLNTGKDKDISYKIYIQDGTTRGEQQVKVCTEGKPIYNKLNNSYSIPKECHQDFVTIDIPNWVDYKGEKLKPREEEYNFRIEGQKGVKDNIDWIGEFDGVKVTEWATWTSSFNNGLIGYFGMNNESGGVTPELVYGVNNATLVSTSIATGGINLNAMYNDGTAGSANVSSASFANFSATTPFSINFWLNISSGNNAVYISKMTEVFNGWYVGGKTVGANTEIGFTMCGSSHLKCWIIYADVVQYNTYGMVTVTYDGSNTLAGIKIYYNGSLASTSTVDNDLDATIQSTTKLKIGGRDYGTEVFTGFLDEVGFWNKALSDSEVTDLYNGGTGIFYIVNPPAVITLNSPVDYFNSTSSLVSINCSAQESKENVQNISLWIDGVRNYTLITGTSNFSELYQTLSFADGIYNWTCSADNNATVTETVWATNRTLTVDTGAPLVNITSIINTTYFTNYTIINEINISLNFSQSDQHLESCWYATNNSVNVSITCNTNTSIVLPYGTYTFWTWANDTLGFESSYNVTATWNYRILQNNVTLNTTTYETKSEGYLINVSTLDSSKLTSVEMIYNNSNVYTTSNLGSGIWRYTLTPTLIGNNTVIFQLTYDGVKYNSSTYYQKVNNILFGLCNSTLTTKYLNISFKDEETNGLINASISSSTFYYYINDITTNKTLTFSNNTNNYEYDFCSLNNETINIIYSIQYLQGSDYPQRVAQGTSLLNNITTNKTLYLLSSSDGIYVTFQVQNANTEQVINGVDVLGTRVISGEEITVAQGTTDSAGSVTFWLNPDFLHTFNFTKTGYSTYTTSIYPTQTSYTISLTSGSAEVSNDYTKGISYSIKPSGDYLTNNTLYNFNITINSTYWSLDEFGFYLYYGNGSLIDSTSSSSVGTIGINANTLNTSYIKMNFYYTINSTYFNGTRTWYVDTGNNSFSILHFFNDLKLYMSVGFFGIDNFGRVLISIFIIVMVIGGIAIRYGIQNEAMLMGILFGIVYFFDVGVGLIPSVTFGGNSISHFPTIAVGLLLAGFLIKEEMR